MLQRSAHPGHPRPLFQEVQQLSDAQLSIMCASHRIFTGPITFQNRRQAERQLHIALIEERARFRAQQKFALECRLRLSGNLNFQPIPPPQQHFDFREASLEQAPPPRNYWPQPRTVTWRSNPPPSSSFRYRQEVQEPVLEPRRYVTWEQQKRINQRAAPDAEDTNILGFKLPFTLETAREITTKIGETLKRFQGGGEDQEAAGLQGGKGNYQDKYHEEQQEDEVAPQQTQQQSGQGSSKDASDDEYQEEDFLGEYLEFSDEDFSYPCSEELDRDTLSTPSEEEKPHPLPYDFRKIRELADAQSQGELCDHLSVSSSATNYYECASQVPLKRAETNISWWWWPRRATAGDERIPVAEQTTERRLLHEHEVKTIDYLSEAPSRVEDGVLELMSRVELREDSEEEDLVELPDGSLGTQPAPRTYTGFGRYIFRLLCCDRHGKLDPEKLRCTFLSCCMAFGIYMGFKMMR